jgi:phenylpyruvate tautomerase PptA (4-oxalocrotonate tautomerase family)
VTRRTQPGQLLGTTSSSCAAARSKTARSPVHVLTDAGALDRAKQLAAVSRLTAVVTEFAGDPGVADRTWVQLTETQDGGWGLAGHANTNDELVALARAELSAG